MVVHLKTPGAMVPTVIMRSRPPPPGTPHAFLYKWSESLVTTWRWPKYRAETWRYNSPVILEANIVVFDCRYRYTKLYYCTHTTGMTHIRISFGGCQIRLSVVIDCHDGDIRKFSHPPLTNAGTALRNTQLFPPTFFAVHYPLLFYHSTLHSMDNCQHRIISK